MSTLRENLGKLGNSIYSAELIDLAIDTAWFVPVATINALRRDAVDALDTPVAQPTSALNVAMRWNPPAYYPDDALSYLGNVFNEGTRLLRKTRRTGDRTRLRMP